MDSYNRILKILLILILIFSLNWTATPTEDKPESKLKAYLQVSKRYYNIYEYDSALLYYDSALIIADQLDDKAWNAHILRLKGNSLRLADNIDSALPFFVNARNLALKLGIDSICARADIGLGHIYENKGLLDSSEYYYYHAYEDYLQINDSLGIGRAMYNLSMFYQTKIDYESSLKYALESHRILKRIKSKGLYASSILNLGNIYFYLKDYDSAYSCYQECKALAIKLEKYALESRASSNIGVIYFQRSEYEKARDAWLKSIEFSESIKDKRELSILYRNTSIVYKRLGDTLGAIDLSERALEFSRTSKIKELEIEALVNLGILHKQTGVYDIAEQYYQEAVEMAERYNMFWQMQIAYHNITAFYETTGDFEKAYEYSQKDISVQDSINNEQQIKARERYKAEYELMHYQDLNRLKELEKKKIRFERNLSFGLGITAIVFLVLILFFIRMRARKNRIIAAQIIQKLEDEKKLMAAQSVMVGEEKERERIARELHDGIGVLLSTASIHFSSVEEKADKETSEMLNKANKLLKDASKEVRQISHNMMPGVLSKFGLREAIEDLCEDVEEASNIKIGLSLTCGDSRLPENMEIMIYRVIQEMINNTIKHAEATKISLAIVRDINNITIDYRDDGKGFDEDKLPHGKNLGLSGIRSRIEYLGGSTALSSEPGKGTSYFISIPLKA